MRLWNVVGARVTSVTLTRQRVPRPFMPMMGRCSLRPSRRRRKSRRGRYRRGHGEKRIGDAAQQANAVCGGRARRARCPDDKALAERCRVLTKQRLDCAYPPYELAISWRCGRARCWPWIEAVGHRSPRLSGTWSAELSRGRRDQDCAETYQPRQLPALSSSCRRLRRDVAARSPPPSCGRSTWRRSAWVARADPARLRADADRSRGDACAVPPSSRGGCSRWVAQGCRDGALCGAAEVSIASSRQPGPWSPRRVLHSRSRATRAAR